MGNGVLIIGCSLSSGSYGVVPGATWGSTPLDQCISPIGWYDRLSCFRGRHIDVYSMPGLGWMSYAHLLHTMASDGTLAHYNTLLIQETFEPRFNLAGSDFPRSFVLSKMVERELSVTHRTYLYGGDSMILSCNKQEGLVLYKTWDSEPRYDKDPMFPPGLSARLIVDVNGSPHLGSMVVASQLLAADIIRRFGLETFVLSFGDPHMDCGNGIKRVANRLYSDVCMPNRDGWLAIPRDAHESYGGHLTEEGNMQIGLMIDSMIQDRRSRS